MNKKTYTAILDDVAREHIPDRVDLAPRILTKIQKRKGISMHPRIKVLVATIVVLLVLAFLLVRVPAVADAMQRILSRFIPGIGIVDISATRALAEPVSVTRDGVTVTVEQLVADPRRTVIVYTVDGFAEPIKPTYEGPDCLETPQLHLPNGVELSYPAGSSGSSESSLGDRYFQANYEFPGLPAEVSELTLVISCLEGTDRGTLPENWEIPLTLVSAPPEMTTYPVVEIAPTAQVTPTTQITLSTPGPTDTNAHNFVLSVDRVVPMDGGYRLYGRLDGSENRLMVDSTMVRLLDANGQAIPGGWDIPELSSLEEGSLPIVYNANTDYIPGQVTLVVDSVMAEIYEISADGTLPSFTFDVGQNPQIDQEWKLNLDIQIENYSLHIATARFFERNGEYGFDFQMSSPNPAVHSAWLLDLNGTSGRYGGSFVGYNGEPFNTEVTYEAGFVPSGTVTISVSLITVTLDGPWQTTLTLPAIEETPNP